MRKRDGEESGARSFPGPVPRRWCRSVAAAGIRTGMVGDAPSGGGMIPRRGGRRRFRL
jgi:hypothetical protein